MQNIHRIFILAVVMAGLAGCNGGLMHKDMTRGKDAPGPRKVLVAQPDVRMYEISLGLTTERVVEWEKQAAQEIAATTERIGREEGLFIVVPLPALDDAQGRNLEQHRALFATMQRNLVQLKHNGEGAWSHKRESFDYTIGPGLSSLREATGADAVLFCLAKDSITSSSRKLYDAFKTVTSLGLSSPVRVPSFLTVGLVDLKTGNVLWYDDDSSKTTALNTLQGIEFAMRSVLSGFPRRD